MLQVHKEKISALKRFNIKDCFEHHLLLLIDEKNNTCVALTHVSRDLSALNNAASWKESKPTCIQRFICEVHMLPEHELATAGDVERNIANTLK